MTPIPQPEKPSRPTYFAPVFVTASMGACVGRPDGQAGGFSSGGVVGMTPVVTGR